MDVDGNLDATIGPYDGISKSTYIEGKLDACVDVRLDGVDGLVSSIRDWKRFKTLCMAWACIWFQVC